jgi:hypothetical protein
MNLKAEKKNVKNIVVGCHQRGCKFLQEYVFYPHLGW